MAKELKKEKKQKYAVEDCFNLDRAGNFKSDQNVNKNYYTKVLEGNKHLKGEVTLMTPKVFLGKAYNVSKIDTNNRSVKFGLSSLTIQFDVRKPKFNILVLDHVNEKSIGDEIAIVADKLGVKEIPVLVCGKSNKSDKKAKKG